MGSDNLNKGIIYIIFGIVTIIGFIIFYKLLSKNKFDLKGYEIIIFQVAFMFLFHIGNYYELRFYQDCISLYLLIMLSFYYLMKTIKTHKYTQLKILILYFILSLSDYLSITFLYDVDSWYKLIAFFFYPIYVGCVIIYILLMNLICLIINKIKKLNIEKDENSLFNNKLKLILIIVCLFIPIIYGVVGNKLYNISENKKEVIAQKTVINYLNQKYDDGNYKIKNIDQGNICKNCFAFTYTKGYTLSVTTDYFANDFEVTITKDNFKIREDSFIFEYLKSLTSENIYDYYDIENYFNKKISNEINDKYLKQYNAKINLEINLDEEKLKEYNFNSLPSIKNIEDLLNKNINYITISKNFTENEIEIFVPYIVEIYETIYNEFEKQEKDNIMNFIFDNGNPFSNSISYKQGGYIKENENMYLIYVDSKPIQLNK